MWKELETRTRKYGTHHSLYLSEIHTIDVIGHHEHLNITQIAQKLGLTIGSTSELLARLKKKGFLNKYFKEDNKKSKYVYLTQLGRQAYEGHKNFHKKVNSYAM